MVATSQLGTFNINGSIIGKTIDFGARVLKIKIERFQKKKIIKSLKSSVRLEHFDFLIIRLFSLVRLDTRQLATI